MATRTGDAAESDRRYTLEEFRALPEEDEHRVELVEGRLVREPRPGRAHGTVVMLLGRHLVERALRHGGLVTTETGFVLSRDPPLVRGPDLAYLRPGRSYDTAPDDWIAGAPDLAVEVVSPSNSAAEIQRKVLEYFDAGSAQVWVVHPRTRTVVAHRSSSEARVLRESDLIRGGELLPGLDVPVAEIFGG